MKNLKKVLSLVLALAMALSLMTVAFAADASGYVDSDKITHNEAVSVLSALNVIDGKDGNKFDPTGTVTRAEMAKMITVICLGDVDVSAFKGTQTDLKDVSGWSEAYVKYCYSQGIISGRGNGIFDPTANVTSAEAAKMLLVAIGYNAKVQGYEGAAWKINTVRDAQLSGFFKDLSVTSDKALTRDEAAQMIYNAVDTGIVQKTPNWNASTGTVTYTYVKQADTNDLLSNTFGAVKEYGYLDAATYDTTKKLYSYTVQNDATFGGTAIPAADDGITDGTVIKSATDYSALFGQKVAVVYKDANTVYGVYSDAKVLAEGTRGSVVDAADDGAIIDGDTAQEIKLGDTKVKLKGATTAVNVYNFNTATVDELDDVVVANANGNRFNKLVAIDNTDDGKADVLVAYPATAAKVTYVGTASITAGGTTYAYDKEDKVYSPDSGTTNYTFPEGIAKDEYVLVPGYGISGVTREMTKVEKFTGKVAATTATKAQIDSTWYKLNGQTATLGDTFDVWAVDGYMVATKVVSSASKDVAMLIADEAASALNKCQAKLMFADGTTKIVEVSKYDGTTLTSNQKVSDTVRANGTNVLLTYKVLDDGTYDVKRVSGSNKAGYDAYASNRDTSTGTGHYEYTAAVSSTGAPAKLDGKTIADDAVIMVVSAASGDAKYSVITGAALKGYSDFDTDANVETLCTSNNGVNVVKVATVITNSNYFGVTASYGYVVSDPFETIEDTTHYNNYDIWTVNGLMTVKDTNYNSTPVSAKGQVVSLQQNNNGTYTGTVTGMTNVAVTGYSSTDNVITLKATTGATYGAVDMSLKDAKVLYVDTKNKVGVEGGEIALAEASANGGYKANAMAYYNVGTSKLELVIVDTSNLLTGTEITCGYTINFVDSVTGATLTANKTKAVEGETVTISGTTSAAATGAKTITVTPSVATGISATATGTVANGSASGTSVSIDYVITRTAAGTPIAGAITLTATGTVN